MALYGSQFSADLDVARDPGAGIARTLVIASTPRCGSHMLGHSLTETGRFGVPFEYVQPNNLAEWKRRLDTTDVADTLAALMARRTTPNGVFSIKLHYPHTRALGGAKRALAAFPAPCVVHIARRDLLVQAMSYARARQTGIWISGQEGTGRPAVYDRALIDACLHDLAWQNAAWEVALRASGLPVLRVVFEDAVADMPATLRRLAAFMEIDLPEAAVPAAPPTRRQSDDDGTLDWLARYAAAPPRRSVAARARAGIGRIRGRLSGRGAR